jgi:hypothetical protein
MTVFNSIWGGGVDLSGITDGNLPLVIDGEFVDSPSSYDTEDFFIDLGEESNTEISTTASLFTFNHTGGNNAFKIITDEDAVYKYALRIATGAGTFGMFADGDFHASELNLDGGEANIGDILFYKDASLGNPKPLGSVEADFIDDTEASFTSRIIYYVGDYNDPTREAITLDADGTEAKIGFFGTTAAGQQAHVADPTDLATSITAISAIIDILEAYGLSATS